MRMALIATVLAIAPLTAAVGQSSSLFLAEQARQQAAQAVTTQPGVDGSVRVNAGAAPSPDGPQNPALAMYSLTAVMPPEPKVIQVNDLVGVIVRHRLRYQSDTRLKQESEWDVQSKLDAWFRIHDRKWVDQDFEGGMPEVNFSNQNDLENKGRADRKDVLETRLKGKVIDVKPNGNLIVVAWTKVDFEDETQYIRLSGECSRDDIAADGNVTSDKIFGLDVQTMNEGALRDATKRGWLKEFTDTVKPF